LKFVSGKSRSRSAHCLEIAGKDNPTSRDNTVHENGQMENLTDIAIFVRVVESGSFTKTAGQLELSRAVISKYLSRLEERLGVRLLNRTTRRLSLTEAGAALYEASRGALTQIEDAELAISELQKEPRGRLKVNVPVSFGMLHLAPALPEFLGAFPGISVDMTMEDRMVDLIAEGYDLLFGLPA
jgi:DNA-binding transcriptional LysR family regulator